RGCSTKDERGDSTVLSSRSPPSRAPTGRERGNQEDSHASGGDTKKSSGRGAEGGGVHDTLAATTATDLDNKDDRGPIGKNPSTVPLPGSQLLSFDVEDTSGFGSGSARNRAGAEPLRGSNARSSGVLLQSGKRMGRKVPVDTSAISSQSVLSAIGLPGNLKLTEFEVLGCGDALPVGRRGKETKKGVFLYFFCVVCGWLRDLRVRIAMLFTQSQHCRNPKHVLLSHQAIRMLVFPSANANISFLISSPRRRTAWRSILKGVRGRKQCPALQGWKGGMVKTVGRSWVVLGL
ncbi:unnamed protein product, partial [Discosporangium mesarthrocarpum]